MKYSSSLSNLLILWIDKILRIFIPLGIDMILKDKFDNYFMNNAKKYNFNSDTVTGLLFIAPFLILWGVFFFYPFMQSFFLSFQNFDFLAPERSVWIGMANYMRLFTQNAEFLNALMHSVLIVIVAVPVQSLFALILAILLNNRIKGRSIFRAICVIPNITSGIAVATIFMVLFRKNAIFTKFFTYLGFPNETWFANVNLALPFVIILYIWQQIGFFMIIYLAGLQNIPIHYYEAATIDGANGYERFWYITLPSLKPITFFVVSVGTINAFQIFDQVVAISRYGVLGQPVGATSTLLTFFYQHGFRYTEDMGLGSAAVIVFFFIILSVTIIQKKILGDNE